MNLPIIINIAIGLIFIYLVLSLLASQIQEIVATIFQWRAAHLRGAIKHLISGDKITNDKSLVSKLFKNPLIQNLNQTSEAGIAMLFSGLGKIKEQVGEVETYISSSPSYMPSEIFSSTILKELEISKAAKLLTWLNAKKLVFYEIELKIDILLRSKGYSSEMQSFKTLRENLREVLSDYKEDRYGLSPTLIRLRNQVNTFKREIKETSFVPITTVIQDSDAALAQNKSLRESINQIIEFIFATDKFYDNDKDLIVRLKPSLTTVFDLLQKESLTYENFEAELNKVCAKKANLDTDGVLKESYTDLLESFEHVDEQFRDISKLIPDNLRDSLDALALRACIKVLDVEEQLDQFKKEIETWFDNSMERSSGVYKRNVRGFAFLIGFGVAVAFNADTFHMVSRLSKDDALRSSIITASTQLVQTVQSSPPVSTSTPKPISSPKPISTPVPTITPTPLGQASSTPIPSRIEMVKDNVDKSLSDITLPIGWTENIVEEQLKVPAEGSPEAKRRVKFIPPLLIMILGWLVTAFAIMMGAPFWFDFLILFINVRNTGSRPKSDTDKK
jgi:hypothetical protein